MPTKITYARILQAVGQVLDQLDVERFAIQEEEETLCVEGYSSEGHLEVQLRYDVAALNDLIEQSERKEAEPEPLRGTLRKFLEVHGRELVGLSH
jgi:hypothetical protein